MSLDLEPVERRSVSDAIVARLRAQILGGRIEPGERLPAQRTLAEHFGTNRNTLREAIRRLEALGLVASRQGSGVVVQDFREGGEIPLLPHFLAEGGDLGERLATLGDALVLRRAVLAEAAALAASRRTADDVEALRELAARQGEDPGRTELIRNDLAFFRRLVEASRSLLGRWVFNTFERVYETFLDRLSELWVVPDGYAGGLEELVTAVESGDPDRARRTLVEHLSRSDAEVLSRLDRLAEGGLPS